MNSVVQLAIFVGRLPNCQKVENLL